MKLLDEATIRRLALIKYLYTIAIEQSLAPEPHGAVSILTFHDCVELFLQLSAEYRDVRCKEPGFLQYWEEISKPPTNIMLTQKESMRRLNKARVSLKHHGTLPSRLDVESFRAIVKSFFEDNTPLVFNIDFESISMINMVESIEVRKGLEEANKLAETGNYEDALCKIALAYRQLVDGYCEDKGSRRYRRSPFFFGQDMTFESAFHLGIEDRKFSQFVDKVKDSIEAMRNAVQVLSFGFDYRRYAKYQTITSFLIIDRAIAGNYILQVNNRGETLSIDDCRFCYEFVIDCALRLQGFDFEVDSSYKFPMKSI